MRIVKRTSALLFCLLLALSLCACGDAGPEPSQDPSPDGNSGDASQTTTEQLLEHAPEHYDYAVLVSINPHFLLFLNGREVFAYEALNEEAKAIEDRVALIGRGLDGGLDDIVRFSQEEGYLKDGGEVNVTVISANATEEDASALLREAEETILRTAENCGIQVNPVLVIDSGIEFLPAAENDPNAAGQDDGHENGGEPDRGNDPGENDGDPEENDGGPEENGAEPDENGGEPEDGGENGSGTEDPGEQGGEPQSSEEGCSVCWGTGVCDLCEGSGIVSCMSCGGSGIVPCHGNCAGGMEDCACEGGLCHACGGSGLDDNGDPCGVCGGSGACAECGGASVRPCPICGGTGEEACGECQGTGQELCPACGGSGVCAACGGTGKKS